MPTLDQVKLEAIFALFKGEPGTRKSTAALSFPTPQYWISTDKKMESLILPGKAWGVDFKQIDYDDFSDWDSPRRKLEQLQLNCRYKTIVIDSITSIGDAINRQVMRIKSGTTTKEGGEKGMRVGGIPVNTIEDYKAEASAFSEMIAIQKDIYARYNTNIILIGHVVGERQAKETGQITHAARIIITGGKAISGKIAAYSSEIYHFNIKGSIDVSKPPEYGLFTVHTGDDFARTALPLPTEIIFGDKPLYDNWIKPAISRLTTEKPITKL